MRTPLELLLPTQFIWRQKKNNKHPPYYIWRQTANLPSINNSAQYAWRFHGITGAIRVPFQDSIHLKENKIKKHQPYFIWIQQTDCQLINSNGKLATANYTNVQYELTELTGDIGSWIGGTLALGKMPRNRFACGGHTTRKQTIRDSQTLSQIRFVLQLN